MIFGVALLIFLGSLNKEHEHSVRIVGRSANT